jgi:hypothetical protein
MQAQKNTSKSTRRSAEPGKVNWWLRVTSAGWDKPQETIEQRERVRRSRLLSWILLGLFVVLIVFIPATLKDTPTVFAVSIAIIGLVIITLCNRKGWITLAGVLLVILTIGAALGVIVGSPDGYIHLVDLPAYDFLVVPVILGASILPRISAFIIAAINISFIYGDLVLQKQAQDLQQVIQQYGLPVIVGRPSALLLITATLAYLWVRGMDQAVQRADKAEELRALEQYLNQIEAEHAERVKEFMQEAINAIGALANGQEGLLLLPPEHPWQQQATFINTQLKQFHKLKQSSRGNNEQLVFAVETLLRLLQRINNGQSPVSALDPRRFTTQVAVTDEIVKQLCSLLLNKASSKL